MRREEFVECAPCGAAIHTHEDRMEDQHARSKTNITDRESETELYHRVAERERGRPTAGLGQLAAQPQKSPNWPQRNKFLRPVQWPLLRVMTRTGWQRVQVRMPSCVLGGTQRGSSLPDSRQQLLRAARIN